MRDTSREKDKEEMASMGGEKRKKGGRIIQKKGTERRMNREREEDENK